MLRPVTDALGLAAGAGAARPASPAARPDDPDADLVRRIGKGDLLAIRALTARKLPRLTALAARVLGDAAEAEDVAQESLIRAWRQAPVWR
ncbi:MAG: RNA polymerase subunit sigma, partial [Phenylobacterium sp.]